MHKKMKVIVCLLFSHFICTVLFAEENLKPIPAVWAWRASSEKRVVYLVGELHSFQSQTKLDLDYKLGTALFNLSDEIWIEPKQHSIELADPPIKLHDLISDELWKKLSFRTKEITSHLLAGKKQDRIDQLTNNIIDNFDADGPLSLYANFKQLVSMEKQYATQLSNFVYPGLKGELINKSSGNKQAKKILNIESIYSVSNLWRQHCGTDENDIIVSSALSDEDFDNLTQHVFTSPNTDLIDIDNVFKTAQIGPILKKCTVVPRNYQWLAKIRAVLATEGPPVAVVVGVGHLSGNEGLINLLTIEPGVNVKRIFDSK